MVDLQREILEKSDELDTLPDLLEDDINLDSQVQSKLNPIVVQQLSLTDNTESITSLPPTITTTTTTTSNTNLSTSTEPISSTPIAKVNSEDTVAVPETSSNQNPIINNSQSPPLTNSREENNASLHSLEEDEFDAGSTTSIQRRNPIIISATNDRSVATICCHRNQLLYNDNDQNNQKPRLTFIPDLTQVETKKIIEWTTPDTQVGGGDDHWIQDITYSTKLQGYLLLNRARLRLFHDETEELSEFYELPDRSMKRVTCNETFIYLISASGMTGQHGDEIILMNYDKEEKICKTFRDLVLQRNNRITGPFVGEISDLAVNTTGQILFSYRLERRQEVGVCMYDVSNNGNEWIFIKQLLLNECWHNDLSFTPRIDWSEKLNLFVLIEFMTGHLIMMDQGGQVKGESRFINVHNQRDSPLNLSISKEDWLCVRYETSINIHRLESSNDRL